MPLQNAVDTKLFIGIDILKKSWSVSIRTELFDHKTFSMFPEPEGLYDYVADKFPCYPVYLAY